MKTRRAKERKKGNSNQQHRECGDWKSEKAKERKKDRECGGWKSEEKRESRR